MTNKTTPTQRALNLWAVILIIWSIYRTYFKMPLWFDEFFAKPLVFVLPVFYYIKNSDKKPILQSLHLDFKPSVVVKDLLSSFVIGGVFLLTAFLASYVKNQEITLFTHFPGINQLTLILTTALATGITEEILSRGFVLKKLYEESKNIYSSVFFSSILFFFLHVPILFANTKITGSMLLMFMTTDLLLSMINGLIFLQRRSLTVPILIHAFYNIIIGLMFI
ncbi:CPBP family intramembrane metalloprotease [Candidatus Roizmanbacteria bacterium]|nr:CPBP family intramembrane metalloprotease [Candidatus Roizmanbacteria bacterium]